MNVHVENVSSVKKKISFEIPADQVAAEIGKVYDGIRKTASLKGFRKGKAPQSVIEKYYGAKMAGDVLKNLVGETYYKAIDENKIIPVAPPTIESDEVKMGEPLKYSATVEVLPEIEVRDYAGLEVQREKYRPNEELINNRLKEMQSRMAEIKPLEEQRPAAMGDIVVLDFKGFLNGVPFENGSAEDYMLELGSRNFIEGFEEQIVGLSVGEQGKVDVTFPSAYSGHKLAGKDVTFEVNIKEIKFKELPELNDEFAKQFGDFETIDQLKAKLAEAFEAQEREKLDARLKDRLVMALIEKNPIEVPQALVEKQLQFLVENAKNSLTAQKLTLEMVGSDEKKLRDEYQDNALVQVKGTLLLEELAKKEGLTVEEREIDDKISEMAEKSNRDSEQIRVFYERNPYAREGLIKQLREEKTISFLMEKAVITEEP